jgi:membrane protease YdiL (CAAX protease family)
LLAGKYPDLYATAGLGCDCLPSQPEEADGLKNVTQVVTGFLALLITILVGGVLQTKGSEVVCELITRAVMYVIILGFCIYNRRIILPLFRLRTEKWWFLLVALAAAPLTVMLAKFQLIVFPSIAKYWKDYSPEYLKAGYGWNVVILSIAVGPAIFEELFFRGVVLHRLARVMTDWQAIIVTAMAFAILHLAAIGLVFYLLPMAIIAGWMTLRSKSLWPAMLFHFLHNGSVIYLEHLGIS